MNDNNRDIRPNAVANPQNLPLLHDLEHYVRSHGILGADAPSADVTLGVDREARVREDEKYKRSVFRKAFRDADAEETISRKERKKIIDSLHGERTKILAADGGVVAARADVLASRCETVYTMVRAKPLFASRKEESKEVPFARTLDLTGYSLTAVEEFLLLMSESESESKSDSDDDSNFGIVSESDSDDNGNDKPSISEANAVEVCRLAHYLQCPSVLELTVRVLRDAVDDDNCSSLAALADGLGLVSLFEATLPFLLRKSLAEMDDDGFWNGAPDQLRKRVVALLHASRSSVLNVDRNVFFASADEFLALVSDDLRDRKERLREARQRQQQLVANREQEGSVRDAAIKIERQEHRIRTLAGFYERQKRLLRFNGRENEPYRP